MIAELVKLGAARLHAKTKAVLWQAINPLGDDVSDFEDFGEIDVMQGLGLASCPWHADETGHAEAVVIRDAGNRNAIAVGARDTRTAAIVGNLKPGDTVLHSTDPQQAAQVQCKGEKRQVVMATKDSRGRGMIHMLDGKNDKVQTLAFGHAFQLTEDGIVIKHRDGTGILITANGVYTLGTTVLGGTTPVAPVLAAPPPGAPAPGVFIGGG